MILSSKKIKELETENEDLRTLLQGFSAKEEQLKRFDELIKRARFEYIDITKRKDKTAETLELLDKEKVRLYNEVRKISYEIKQLQELKVSENNQLLVLSNALLDSGNFSHDEKLNQLSKTKNILYQEIDDAEKRKNSIKKENFELEKRNAELNRKIKEVKAIEHTLRSEIEKRKEEISILIENHNTIIREHQENLKAKISMLNGEGSKTAQEKGFKISVDQFSQEEIMRKNLISELDQNINLKKSQLESLQDDYRSKTALLNEASAKNNNLLEELELKTSKLSEINESLEISTAELTDLDHAMNVLEREFTALSKMFQEKLAIKNDIDEHINGQTKSKNELEKELKELRETVTILSRLKNDIEQGSGLSAKRFAGVLKYYGATIGELVKEKLQLEKILSKKQKDIDDLDNLLYEKQSVLHEVERALFIRQDTEELFQESIKRIQGQWEQIKNIIPTQDQKYFDKILRDKEEISGTDHCKPKIAELEKSINDLIEKSAKYFSRFDKKRFTVGTEKQEYNERLNELNSRVRASVDELTKLQKSINKIKEEHEEHRHDINKLSTIKKKLEEDIGKYETTIGRYEKVMEEIKHEQNSVREKRISQDQSADVIKQKENKNSQDLDKFNWIKT